MKEKIARKLLMYDMPHVDSWDLIDARIRKDYMHRADAVLDALMEPTEGMVEAGTARDDGADRTNAIGVSRAMIQAARDGK